MGLAFSWVVSSSSHVDVQGHPRDVDATSNSARQWRLRCNRPRVCTTRPHNRRRKNLPTPRNCCSQYPSLSLAYQRFPALPADPLATSRQDPGPCRRVHQVRASSMDSRCLPAIVRLVPSSVVIREDRSFVVAFLPAHRRRRRLRVLHRARGPAGSPVRVGSVCARFDPGRGGRGERARGAVWSSLVTDYRQAIASAWRDDAVTGFDLTLSGPKSVSTPVGVGRRRHRGGRRPLACRCGRRRARLPRRACVDVASWSRRGRANQLRRLRGCVVRPHDVAHRGPVAAHALVVNKVQCVDGGWRTLDGREVYHRKKSAGAIYQLHCELSSLVGSR
jgi:hypothetical protein